MALFDRLDRLVGIGPGEEPSVARRRRTVAGIAAFTFVVDLASLVTAIAFQVSVWTWVMGLPVLTAAIAALWLVRVGRHTAAAWLTVCGLAGVIVSCGLFRDGFFVTVSPGIVSLLLMGLYVIGPRGGAWFGALIALGIGVVCVAHLTGHVLDANVLPSDPRAMLAFNATMSIPSVWFFQRLDRLTGEEAALALRSAKDRLAQTDKLAAVGQLAAGVAHELNNPLAVILAFAQGMERRHGDQPELQRPISAIVRESVRCKELVHGLLTFSRNERRSVERIDLNEAVRSVAALVEPRSKTQGTALDCVLSAEALTVTGNRLQLEQVLVNLANNALDAMERGGSLTLRTRKGDAGAAIDVVDTGSGVPVEIRDRIFEPFFTTKPVGKGTGLGLSISWEIVRQLGGTIELQSEVGRGTTMVVHLPSPPA